MDEEGKKMLKFIKDLIKGFRKKKYIYQFVLLSFVIVVFVVVEFYPYVIID